MMKTESKKIRIGIDMAATVGQMSGFGSYVESLTQELQPLQVARGFELVPFHRIQKNLRTPYRIAWDQVGLPFTAMSKNVDVLFVPAFSAPRFSKPVVMTAHDIYGIRYPEQFSGLAKRYWVDILPNSMKRADHVIAISEHTKQEIMEYLRIPEEKITVIPNAASTDFRMIDDADSITNRIQKLGVKPPFIVSVGTIEPRKNYERLIDAFAFSKRENHQLVIVGKKGWSNDGVFEKVKKYHLEKAVKFVDYVDRADLIALYNACTFFVMPSLYEGFGLPALEAMQCGAAVMVSQNTSLPEVAGNAGMLFDPFDADDIRKRMDLLFTDIDLRRNMQQASVLQAQSFSWKTTAEKTADVLMNAVKKV